MQGQPSIVEQYAETVEICNQKPGGLKELVAVSRWLKEEQLESFEL